MKGLGYHSRTITKCVCLFICVMGVLIIGLYYNKVQGRLTNVSLSSEDGAIRIKWNSLDWITYDYVTVRIEDDNGIVQEKDLSSIIKETAYENGEHGKVYTVSVSAHHRDGSLGENIVGKTLFIENDQLPDIPLMTINTYSGNDPTYDEAEIPDDVMGGAMINNEYLSGEMVMSGGGIESVSMGVDIRVRGNTSSVLNDKKSYKIKLENRCDLLGRNKGEYSCKEWVLLNNGVNLKTYIGDYVGALCGMDWQPQMMFVNVILNGDWKGCYCLTEAVSLESSYGLVSETGYIFENDAYWWNSDDLYFKLDNQQYQFGYTFKYPKISNKDEKAVWLLQNYMQEFENRILSGDVSYQDYIDEKSYSSWILARDIMGNADSGGSNMYFYKYDFDENDPTSSKVKMGPLWDFDAAFKMDDDWSTCRNISCLPQLFEQDSFVDKYTETWEEISPSLYDDIEMLLIDLDESYGEDIEASWRLDGNRWGREMVSFHEQKEQALDWFSQRVIWMNNSLQISQAE